MKMLIFIILIAGCLAVSYACAGTDTLAHEPFRIEKVASGEAQWALHQRYHQTQLNFKGNCLEAYYIKPENLVGFGKAIETIDLPATIKEKITRRFRHCNIVNAMLYIDAKGRIYYYAGVVQSKRLIALKVSSRCRLTVLQKIAFDKRIIFNHDLINRLLNNKRPVDF